MVNYPHSSESVYGKNCQRNKLYIPKGGRGAPPPFPVAPMGVRVVVLSLDTRDIRLSALCIKYPLNNKIKLSIFKGGNENLYNFKIFFPFVVIFFFSLIFLSCESLINQLRPIKSAYFMLRPLRFLSHFYVRTSYWLRPSHLRHGLRL